MRSYLIDSREAHLIHSERYAGIVRMLRVISYLPDRSRGLPSGRPGDDLPGERHNAERF